MNQRPSPRLFEEIRLRDLTLRNRLVLSPMCQYSAENGLASDYHLVHLARFAMGGFGLVMVESTAVTAEGRITYADLGLWNDEQIGPLRRIADLVHANGAAIGLQLGHAGHKSATLPPWVQDEDRPDEANWEPVSCTSDPFMPGWRQPRALTTDDLEELVEAYVAATERAAGAQIDAIELHMAHGYLLHSFLSPLTNHRADEFGGDLAGRSRFPLMVAAAVRAAWPESKPLFVRLSAVDNGAVGDQLEETVQMAEWLRGMGIDVIDCSSGGLGDRYVHPMGYGYQVEWSKEIRERADVATMAVGLITNSDQAQQIVADGQADLVALGREALRSPSWPLLAQESLGQFAPRSRFDLLPIQSRGWLVRRQGLLDKIDADSA